MQKNREKRKSSDKHGGRASNSVPGYSTVFRNDAMEFEKVLTMDHEGGSSAGVDDGVGPPDCRYFAWLLREKLNALVDGDQGEPPELELQSLLNMAASRKIISVDPKMLNPILWRNLPKQLLLLVFARLPVPDITRLRSLSKEWNKDMATVNSEINRACDESSPIMIAGLSPLDSGTPRPEFLVTICTQTFQNSYRLHNLGDPIPSKNRWDDMGALHGGLVCFVSTWNPSKSNPLCIVVVNLLTRVQHKLPSLKYVYYTLPKMMHIKVESETKCYRVVVIGENKKGRPIVEIYHSGARKWTKATPPLGCIFGVAHTWEYNIKTSFFRSASTTPSLYDFAEGQLKPFDARVPSQGASVMTHVVHQDCMFVLHRNASDLPWGGGYYITKYRIQNNAKEWVQERSYSCSPFEPLAEMKCRWVTLKAFEGFLMAFEPFDDYQCEYFWLLDLSTGEWSSLPNCFDDDYLKYWTSMTQASWNVVP